MAIAQRSFTGIRRMAQVAGAFFRIDWIDLTNYPLALAMRFLNAFVPIVTYLFVAQLVDGGGADVAFDYYTFVVIGIVAMGALAASLNSFGNAMLRLVEQGQLEMFLVEPVPWRTLPFAMMTMPGLMAVVMAVATLIASVPLGASYRVSAIPSAFVILMLGLVATLAIGIAGASVKILSKRADPVLALYSIAASVLSGAFYPVGLLPKWLQTLSWAIPHTYVIQALRRLLMPEGEVLPGPDTSFAIVALILFCLVTYPIALWIFGRTLEYGRKIGALSGY